MRIGTVGSVVVALMMVAGCDSSTERGRDASYVAVSPSPPAAAGAPTADGPSRREAKASAFDAAGLSERAYAPETQGATQTTTFPTSQSAADSMPAAMIIRTGDASIEVDSLESGIAAIRSLATRLSGYVETIIQKSGDSREALLGRVRDLLDDSGVVRASEDAHRRGR